MLIDTFIVSLLMIYGKYACPQDCVFRDRQKINVFINMHKLLSSFYFSVNCYSVCSSQHNIDTITNKYDVIT